MASFKPYYTLCPLEGPRGLLGVRADSTSDHVIVTLGRNIAVRYKLSDQKQVNSWASRHRLSAPVVLDSLGKQYVGVMNHSQLAMWSGDEPSLDSVKRFSFKDRIFNVCAPLLKEPYVIFDNGWLCSLSLAVEHRKDEHPRILEESEILEGAHVITEGDYQFAVLFSRKPEESATLLVRLVAVCSETTPVVDNMFLFPVARDECTLLGYTLMEKPTGCVLLTAWSDGQIFMCSLSPFGSSQVSPPGHFQSCLQGISLKHSVAMTALDRSHVAFYAADQTEEGAVLLIVDTQFWLTQAHQQLKLFSEPPEIWHFESRLFVPIGQNLVVVPLSISTPQLAGLIGAQVTKGSDAIEIHSTVEECDWNEDLAKRKTESEEKAKELLDKDLVPETIKEMLLSLLSAGQACSVICQEILPSVIEKGDLATLRWCVSHFGDVPESLIVEMVKFVINVGSDSGKDGDANEKLTNGSENAGDDDERRKSTDLGVAEEGRVSNRVTCLLNDILNIPFSEVFLLDEVRALGLSQVISLLTYLWASLKTTNSSLPVNKIVQWCCVLLDAHYHSYILSQDNEVTSLMCKLKQAVDEQMQYINTLKDLSPLMMQIRDGKDVPRRRSSSKWYSVEVVKFY